MATARHAPPRRANGNSPFQQRQLFHRSSDPEFSDLDLLDAVDMGEQVGWANLTDPIYADKDFEIYRPTPQQSALPTYYLKGWLPYSADTLFNVLLDERYRVRWDRMLQQIQTLEQRCDSHVMYSVAALPWPLAKRDYVYHRRTKFFPQQNTFVVLCESAHHARAPEHKQVVRVETYSMRMCIRSTGRQLCDFHIEYEDDTNFSIPNYVVNWLLSSNVPSFLTDLRRACARYASFAKTTDAALLPSNIVRQQQQDDKSPRRNEIETRPVHSTSESITNTMPTDPTLSSHSRRRLASDAETKSSKRSTIAVSSPTSRSSRLRQMLTKSKTERSVSTSRDSRAADEEKDGRRVSLTHKHAVARQASATTVVETFAIEFRKSRIGLHLETEAFTNRILVAFCDKQSEAAQCSPRIEPGMVITSVNGKSVAAMGIADIMDTIKHASRPLRLGFGRNIQEPLQPPQPSPAQPGATSPKLECVVGREDAALLRALRPMDNQEHCGAILGSSFSAVQFSKNESLSPRQSLLAASEHSSAVSLVQIPAGHLLYEIDHSCVIHLGFAEIVHLLSRNAEPKVLSFKAADAADSNDDADEETARPALRSRLRGMLRWRTGSDESPSSHRKHRRLRKTSSSSDEGGGSKVSSSSERSAETNPIDSPTSTAGTAAATVVGTTTASDPLLSSRCLVDYSNVAISCGNIACAWDHVHLLKNDERLFSAALLINKIEAFLMKEHDHLSADSTASKLVLNKMHAERDWIHYIKETHALGVQALHEFNSEEDSDWNFGQTYFGVSTHWKPGDDGTVWLKLDGLVEGVDIFNTISVMREIDLFSCWVPCCNSSSLLHREGNVDLYAYVSMVFPLLRRDMVMHVVGVNACYESRCILLLGSSVEDSEIPPSVEVPRLKGWNADRLEMRAFRALIEPITRGKARTCVVCNLDPKCPIPRSLLNMAIKRVAGILLYLLRKEAEKIEKAHKDGTSNPHVDRVTQDPHRFYEWIRPIIDQWFIDKQHDALPAPLQLLPAEDWAAHPHRSPLGGVHPQATAAVSPTGPISSSDPSSSDPSSRRAALQLTAFGASTVSAMTVSHRTWFDYLYDFGIWPYVLLLLFAGVTPQHSFQHVAILKLLFTCTCTWFGVPGAFSWQTRQLKWARRELDPLRRRFVLLAAICDVLNSWLLRVWVHGALCQLQWFPEDVRQCAARSPLELREAENFWLIAAAFVFASIIVGIQVVVNI